MTIVCSLAIATSAGGAGSQTAAAADWPQFRGPSRDGISAETGLRFDWDSGPPRLWRVPLGEGFSGISVLGERVFTQFGRDGSEYIAAFDAATGAEAWRFRVDELYRNGQGNGPRATPTLYEGIAYGLSGNGNLFAVSMDDGLPVWQKDLGSRYGASGPTWGFSSSPLIDGDLLLADVGGRGEAGIVAFDHRTGEERWRSQGDTPGYAAPLALDVGGVRQAVFFTGERVLGLTVDTGRLLWDFRWRTSYDVNAATPVFVPPDRLFVASGYGVGSAMLRLERDGDGYSVEEIWRSRELENQFSSSVYHDGYLYGFDNAILQCLDAETGERLWRTRGYGHGSLLFADGHLIVLSDRGTLGIVRATPAGYEEMARAALFDARSWTVPTLAGGTLYVRNERELTAFRLAGDSHTPTSEFPDTDRPTR